MANTTPISVERSLRQFGVHISTWRKLQRITADELAERAGVSRGTVYALEHGRGNPSLTNVLRVLRAIGVMDTVVSAADPYATEVGRLRIDEVLPERVRRS